MVAVQEYEAVALLQGVLEEDFAASQKSFLGLLLLEDRCTFRDAEQTSVGLWVVAVLHVVLIEWGVRTSVWGFEVVQRHLSLRGETLFKCFNHALLRTELEFLRIACLLVAYRTQHVLRRRPIDRIPRLKDAVLHGPSCSRRCIGECRRLANVLAPMKCGIFISQDVQTASIATPVCDRSNDYWPRGMG